MTKILVLYGSLTGNTQNVAEKLTKIIKAKQPNIALKNVAEAQVNELQDYDYLILGSSTWDDGHLQYDFQSFYDQLESSPPDLNGKKLAVFGCGDTAYEKFCAAVQILENKFTQLGCEKIIAGLKIDGFPDDPANLQATEQWGKKLREKLG
ncbi:MAG: flavodoxin [Candidatus Pacebacteria bacterium]|nr:flavodoxin [Candidatus Paceibacterota bacterium]